MDRQHLDRLIAERECILNAPADHPGLALTSSEKVELYQSHLQAHAILVLAAAILEVSTPKIMVSPPPEDLP